MNKGNNGQYFGVTEPISYGGPSEFDIVKTQELEKVTSLSLSFHRIFIFLTFFC